MISVKPVERLLTFTSLKMINNILLTILIIQSCLSLDLLTRHRNSGISCGKNKYFMMAAASSSDDSPSNEPKSLQRIMKRKISNALSAIGLSGLYFASPRKANGKQQVNPTKKLTTSFTTQDASSDGKLLNFDEIEKELCSTVRQGRIYVWDNFLSDEMVTDVRNYILNQTTATDRFKASGLSNNALGNRQSFGKNDRQVTPINREDLAQSSTLDNTLSKVNHLRKRLAMSLQRPSLQYGADKGLAHEFYFSVSRKGSSLRRHVDEKHEELKGAKGWMNPSRRSLSWLIYLSEPGWEVERNGGALRAFPQYRHIVEHVPGSSHEDNLQIAWMVVKREKPTSLESFDTNQVVGKDTKQHNEYLLPVFLDCWRKVKNENSGADSKWAVKSALYTLVEEGQDIQRDVIDMNQLQQMCDKFYRSVMKNTDNRKFQRKYLTKNFDLSDPLTGQLRSDFSVFLLPAIDNALAATSPPLLLLEDTHLWEQGGYPAGSMLYADDNSSNEPSAVVSTTVSVEGSASNTVVSSTNSKRNISSDHDTVRIDNEDKVIGQEVAPIGGRLVIFDSVLLPHEVLTTLKGDRVALAGWFHEQTQVFPEWLAEL